MKQDEVVEADEATLTPEMADAWAKVFLSMSDRFSSEPSTSEHECNAKATNETPTRGHEPYTTSGHPTCHRIRGTRKRQTPQSKWFI